MKWIILWLFSMPLLAATHSESIVKNLALCFPAKELARGIASEVQMRGDLQRPDLRLRLNSGYTNNEISSNNPERFQVGANVRWDDVLDNQRRYDYQKMMSQSRIYESKITLENFWRLKLASFYFWKWGGSSVETAKKTLAFAQKKLAAGESAVGSLATTRIYSDLLELNRLSSEFLGRMDSLEKEFAHCPRLSQAQDRLDLDFKEIESSTGLKSNRLIYQQELCRSKKTIKTIANEKEAGKWGLSLTSSINRNRQLAGGDNEFNDVRAGVEVTIPISGVTAASVVVDGCDYETQLLKEEDQTERAIIATLQPIIKSMHKQFLQLKHKLEDATNNSGAIATQDVVQLSLNFFSLHQSLVEGETKLNARIIPARIVEHEL